MDFFKTLVAILLVISFSANAAEYKAPRGPGGVNPDINGVWQALNSANYDTRTHAVTTEHAVAQTMREQAIWAQGHTSFENIEICP